jgi:hypothetical protein
MIAVAFDVPDAKKTTPMKTLNIALFLSFALTAVNLWADANSDAIQKLSLLPGAPLVLTVDTSAGSPTVVLTDKGALINNSKTPVPFDQVLSTLADLPKEAWPAGRVVSVSTNPPADSGYGAAPKSAVDQVESDLQSANIRVLHP